MDIKIPSVGESVVEALVAKWMKKSGSVVAKDEILCEIETDKITMELHADVSGTLTVMVPEGESVKIGTVIGRIDEGATLDISATPASALPPSSPQARKLATEKGVDLSLLAGSGKKGRVMAGDVLTSGERELGTGNRELGTGSSEPGSGGGGSESEPLLSVRSEEPTPYGASEISVTDPATLHPAREQRVPMTPIRKRISERLLAARQQTAMLTTFNEADMSRIIELRGRHKEQMRERHGVPLGFMSFFVKACCEALREFPTVNASIDNSDIVFHNYYDIGIAISGKKGLVVPIIRGADRLHFWEIEQKIVELAARIEGNRLEIADLQGGTFTISNGGVYGSLLSTPILNPPQSGVLGMHAIQERPVVRDGMIVIRPMMYLALSYDHRLIDGREAVEFLKRVKALVEEPEELLLES